MTCPPDHPHNNNCYVGHGCRDTVCREKHAEYMRRYRGRPVKMLASTWPATERLRALYAIGWTPQTLADESGLPIALIKDLLTGNRPTVTRRNGDRVIRTFNRLCMSRPEDLGYPGKWPGVCRRRARERGWLPPLDLKDIA